MNLEKTVARLMQKIERNYYGTSFEAIQRVVAAGRTSEYQTTQNR